MNEIESAFHEGFHGEPPAVRGAAPEARPEAPEADFQPIKDRIAEKYPVLAKYLGEARLQWGDQKNNPGGGHLEFFPPWELHNPNPGNITIELYNRGLKGQWLEDAIAGDMLHHLGSVNPETGQPIDAKWREMREALIRARDPQSIAMDERAYAAAQKSGDKRSFDDWMDHSRADAHVRGYITPDKDNQWKDAYTPEQRQILEGMKAHLQAPPPAPGLINQPAPR